jgi:SNF2 family DNA or RNA helicase
MLMISPTEAQCTYSTLITHLRQIPRQLTHFETRFQHKITGSKSKAPDDMLGGILADDMGLGKTLTMIATVVTTISRAEHFATGQFSHLESTNPRKIPVMSTLVIVPSVCQYAWCLRRSTTADEI